MLACLFSVTSARESIIFPLFYIQEDFLSHFLQPVAAYR